MDSPDSSDWWDVLDVSVGGLASSSASASASVSTSAAAAVGTAEAPVEGYDALAVKLEGGGDGAAAGTALGFTPAEDAVEQSGGGDSGVQEGLNASRPSSSKLVASTSSRLQGWNDDKDYKDETSVAGAGKGQTTGSPAMERSRVDAGGGVKVKEETRALPGRGAALNEGLGHNVGDGGGGAAREAPESSWKQEKAQSLREVRLTIN